MKYFFIKDIIIFGTLVCFSTHLFSQGTELQAKVQEFANKAFYKHASLGISVRDIGTGQILAQNEKDKMLIPASSLKLVTTLAAYELLGSDFTFETRLTHDGNIEPDGTLKGNIYIEGSGDPTLGSQRIKGVLDAEALFVQVVNDIRRFGINCVEGNIIADESIFNSFPISPSWQWNDLGNYYAAGAWGLNINENEYSIYYHRSGPIGSLSKIAYFYPYIPDLQLSNEVTIDSAGTGDNAYIFGGPYHYGKRIVGTIPQGKDLFKIKGSIPDPPMYIAYKILTELEKREMGGQSYKTQYHPDNKRNSRKLIATYTSPSLKNIITQANENSINIYCESLLKTIGFEQRKQGAGSAGIAEIENFIASKKVDITALHMEDGSGLSTRNLISPDFMAEFLGAYAKDKNIDDVITLIPSVGVNGTVKSLLTNSKAKGKMWIKSGSMDKTLSYSGYCKAASGRWVSFCIMLNASTAKKNKENKTELEKILEVIYRFS